MKKANKNSAKGNTKAAASKNPANPAKKPAAQPVKSAAKKPAAAAPTTPGVAPRPKSNKSRNQRLEIQRQVFSGPKIKTAGSRAGTKKATLTEHGRVQNFLWWNDPASGWYDVKDYRKVFPLLPNGYVYRSRIVDKNGVPVPLKRKVGVDKTGTFYIGETGIQGEEPSERGGNHMHGLADKAVGTAKKAHGGAKKFWTGGWDKTFEKLSPGYRMQFGWDVTLDTVIPAAKDVRDANRAESDEVIANSNKSEARGLEDKMLHPFEQMHGELPPGNTARSPGYTEVDHKTGNTSEDDRQDRSEGEVDVEIVDRMKLMASLKAKKPAKAAAPKEKTTAKKKK